MPRRYVLALVKHETNTFSPIPTPLSSFGHGEGPAFGRDVVERFRGTNTPLAAYLDLATRLDEDQGDIQVLFGSSQSF